MHRNTFKEELKKALPEGHPLVDKVDEIATGTDGVDSIVDVIEDWKRGMRDWSEVENVISIVKDN